jgi:hypothetical protein
MRLPLLLLALPAVLYASSVDAQDTDAVAYLSKYEVPQPNANEVVVCHGFGCKFRTPVRLNGNDIARLRSILTQGKQSAQGEMNAIANAVAWFEQRIGPIAGTTRRTARAGPDQAGEPGEADCIDESVNTTALLLRLAKLNLLKHHEVAGPESRGYLLDMRYPHATAVIVNLQTGFRWAIDPWTKRNGERPDTLPLERWKRGS